MGTYYGQNALEGFGRMYASLHGVNVQFVAGANAAVDGAGTIILPALDTFQTLSEFEDTCAAVIHEISHVKYGSHKVFRDEQDPKVGRTKLFMECLNAVLDVADETGIGYSEAKMRGVRTEELLVNANAHCWNNRQKELSDPNGNPVWQILVSGIIRTRLNGTVPGTKKQKWPLRGRTTVGRGVLSRYGKQVDVPAIFRELSWVHRTSAGSRSAYPSHMFGYAAERIARLLEPLAPPESKEPANQPGQPDANGSPSQNGQGTPMPGGMGAGGTLEDALAKGTKSVSATDKVADEKMGEEVAKGGPGTPTPGSQTPSSEAGTGASYGPAAQSPPNRYGADTGTVSLVLPTVRRIADRMAVDGDSLSHDGGYSTGGSVRDVYRLFTDGYCMGRWNEDPHADGMALAIALDISVSMGSIIRKVAGIAEAFSLGMEDFATVRRYTFGTNTKEVASYKDIHSLEGSTMTGEAIYKAREWLMTQRAGKKVLLILTDGKPGDEYGCENQCRLTLRDGIAVIGIGLNSPNHQIDRSSLTRYLPGATCYIADTPNILAMQIERLSYDIEAMRV